MGYTKATDVLPQKLVEHIQSYVDGKLLYIPRKPSAKREWGDNTDTKKIIAARNLNIYLDYQSGMTVPQLADKYFLVEKNIKRILREQKI